MRSWRPGWGFPILPALLAIAAAALTYNFLAAWQVTTAIPVAASDMTAMTRITPALVRTVQAPVRGLLPGVITQASEIVGKYTRTPVFEGEAFVAARLLGGDASLAWKFILGEGRRAFLIPVTVSRACGGVLEPGNLVDVLFVTSSSKSGQAQATRILASVPVLDLRDEDGAPLTRSGRQRGGSGLAGVLVGLSPEECATVALCIEQGHVYLAIAPPESRAITSVTATMKDVTASEK
jgi:Flp pilus assembly protein CpaB